MIKYKRWLILAILLAVISNGCARSPEDKITREGIVYARNVKYDESISAFNKAIEIDPNYVQAYTNRAVAYSHLRELDSHSSTR